jgi:hypothetical protein
MRALENYYAHTTFKRWPVFNCARLRNCSDPDLDFGRYIKILKKETTMAMLVGSST